MTYDEAWRLAHKATSWAAQAHHEWFWRGMTGPELVITAFAERAGTEIMRKRDTQGYAETKAASVDGAKVAAVARQALEEQLGALVVSKISFSGKFIEKQPDGA
jgi:hypothetical protein